SDETRLEEEDGTVALGDDDVVDQDAEPARARQRVDAVKRIARVDEDLLVLLEPRIHAVEVEGEVAARVRRAGLRVDVPPRGGLGTPVADANGPVRGAPLVGRVGYVVA